MLYLIGNPATGKSALVRRLLRGVEGKPCHVPNIRWIHYNDQAAQLGGTREIYNGTDVLHLTAQRFIIEWLRERPYECLLAEGDRLGNESFFKAVQGAGYRLTVVSLEAPRELLDSRREKRLARIQTAIAEGRMDEVGNPMRQGKPVDLTKPRSESWYKGRETKNSRLIEGWVKDRYRLDGSLPLRDNARILRRHPVIRAIRGE